VGIDSDSAKDTWHLDTIDVRVPSKSWHYTIAASCWLKGMEDMDNKTFHIDADKQEAHAKASVVARTASRDGAKMIAYRLALHTADEANAATDCNLWSSMFVACNNRLKLLRDSLSSHFSRISTPCPQIFPSYNYSVIMDKVDVFCSTKLANILNVTRMIYSN
jgi:hypothetical protein